MTLLERLADIEERLKAATPGPWRIQQDGVRDSGGFICFMSKVTRYTDQEQRYIDELATSLADKTLIAHAPTDLAMLLEIVKVQAEALEWYAKPDGDDTFLVNGGADVQPMGRRAHEALARVQALLPDGGASE